MLAVLYHFYRWSTAAKFLLGRRILPAGWGIGIVAVVSGTMLMGSPITPLYQMFALLFGLTAVGLFWTWSRRARLQAQRELPTHAAVGQVVRYSVVISNLGNTLRLWSLQETPADPRPSLLEFSVAREPGEAWRNRFDRFFAFNRWQWLLEKGKMYEGGESAPAPLCERGNSCRLTLSLVPHRRGRIVFDDLRVRLPDPFHFFQRVRKVAAPTAHLAVLPRRYPLPRFELPGSARFQPGGEATSRHSGAAVPQVLAGGWCVLLLLDADSVGRADGRGARSSEDDR